MENDRLKKALLHSSTEESIRNKNRVDKIKRMFSYMEEKGATIEDVCRVFNVNEIDMLRKSGDFNIEDYKIENATHLLKMSKMAGNKKIEYTNKCIPISTTKSGKVKVVSFGNIRWKYSGHTKRMHYVTQDRLVAIFF